MPRRYRLLLALATGLACFTTSATRAEPITLWPSVPFVRGQDICQFTDAYGLGKRQQTGAMIGHLERLLAAGIDPEQAVDALRSIDQIVERDRSEARRGDGIDTLLEGSFKASLEEIYARAAPETRMLEFFNPAALDQALAEVRSKRSDRKSALSSLKKVDAFAWEPIPMHRAALQTSTSLCMCRRAAAESAAFKQSAAPNASWVKLRPKFSVAIRRLTSQPS